MSNFWMTQDTLRLVGWTYVAVCAAALLLALWTPKRWWAKTIAAACVLGLASILPMKAKRQQDEAQAQAAEFTQRQAKAKALFEERCKTAGEKIYKTVEDVDGVFLPRLRERTGRADDPMTPEAAAWSEHSGNGYIIGLLLFAEPANNNAYKKSFVESRTRFPGFKFVEVSDPRWPPQTAPLMATQTAPGRTGQL